MCYYCISRSGFEPTLHSTGRSPNPTYRLPLRRCRRRGGGGTLFHLDRSRRFGGTSVIYRVAGGFGSLFSNRFYQDVSICCSYTIRKLRSCLCLSCLEYEALLKSSKSHQRSSDFGDELPPFH